MRGPITLLVLLSFLAVSTTEAEVASSADPLGVSPVGFDRRAAARILEVNDQNDLAPPANPLPAISIVADSTPKVGSSGPVVMAIEERLALLRYLTGKVDGIYDKATHHGVTAFQKVHGLARTGRADPETLELLGRASTPSPRYTSPPDHIELDVARQVVFVVRGGVVANILVTSTGSGKKFTNQGWTRRAITPNGRFKIYRKINGMRISPLGELYKPSYFDGGIAFHGNGSVPAFPASHGCARLPMQFADWFFTNAAPMGHVVYVYGGPNGENPQPVIDDKPAASPSPTSAPAPSPSPTATHGATDTVTTTVGG